MTNTDKCRRLTPLLPRYELFRHSSGVHFYHSSSQSGGKVDWIKRPRFYGARKPAYLVLALDHCPIAYWSKDNKF